MFDEATICTADLALQEWKERTFWIWICFDIGILGCRIAIVARILKSNAGNPFPGYLSTYWKCDCFMTSQLLTLNDREVNNGQSSKILNLPSSSMSPFLALQLHLKERRRHHTATDWWIARFCYNSSSSFLAILCCWVGDKNSDFWMALDTVMVVATFGAFTWNTKMLKE